MKDRWKILISSLVILSVLAAIFFFVGFSIKIVGLRDYGVLQYSYFQTVDSSQTIRQNGNYLVGLDHSFIEYPRGLIKHEFTIDVLTQDKSIIKMQGLFLGQLIASQIINLHFLYGPIQYLKYLKSTIQQQFLQAIQQYSLSQILYNRTQINSYIKSNICLTVQSTYSWISCNYVSIGAIIHLDLNLELIPLDLTVHHFYNRIIQDTIYQQQKLNVYQAGGVEFIHQVQKSSALLFKNITENVVEVVKIYTQDPTEIFAASAFILDNPLMPILSNQITFTLKKS